MRRHAWAIVLIVAAVLAAYSNAPRNGFVWDDHVYIEANPFVQDPRNVGILVDPRYYLGAHEVLVGTRPVYLASLMLDRALWGARPAGYHLSSVLLHAADAAWVYAVACALGLPGLVPLLAALLFGLHPLQTEAVDLVSFRAEPLAAFFTLAGLWLFLRARRRRGAAAALLLAGCAALFALGLLSKETAILLPLLAGLSEVFFPVAEGRRRRLTAAAIAFALIAMLYAGFWAPRFRYFGMDDGSAARTAVDRAASFMPTSSGRGTFALSVDRTTIRRSAPWEWNALHADGRAWAASSIKTLAGYFRLLLLPYPLIADRAPLVARGFAEPGVLASLALLLLVAAYAAWARKRDPASAFGAAWCLVALLPASNVVPLYIPMAERYVYLFTAGAALAAASALARLTRSRGETIALAAALCAVLGVMTRARTADWLSDETLFLSGPEDAPRGSMALVNRGDALRRRGRYEEAAVEYERAAAARPGFAQAWLGLGASYAALGQPRRATAAYEKALSAAPDDAFASLAYGLFLSKTGQPARAVEMLERSVRLEPRFAEAWLDLGRAYEDSGRAAKARDCYIKAAGFAPGDPLPVYTLAVLVEKGGDRAKAARLLDEALRRDASFEPARTLRASLVPRAR